MPLTSTGVFKPATVFPTEPVNDPALDTVTFASASKSNDPVCHEVELILQQQKPLCLDQFSNEETARCR